MDSRRFILAVILMVAVMVVTNLLFPAARPTPARTSADSAAVDTTGSPVAANPRSPASSSTPSPAEQAPGLTAAPQAAPVAGGAAPGAPVDTVYVESDRYRYGFSTRGGALVHAAMLNHESFTGGENQPVDLADIGGKALISYRVTVGDQTIDISRLDFRPEPAAGFRVAVDGAQQLRLVHADSVAGFAVDIEYGFVPDAYVIDTHVSVRGIGNRPAKLLIEMGPNIAQSEADSTDDARHRAYVLNPTNSGGLRSVKLPKLQQATTESGPFSWVALRSKYFVAALLSSSANPVPFGGVIAQPIRNALGADLTATLLPAADGRFGFRMYVGPQEPDQLEAIGDRFKDVNPFGFAFLRPVLMPLGHALASLLYGMHNLLGISYGWVLIIFGVLIRVLLWPLNAKAMRSQMKNMEMQPRIKEIQARYKKEPEKLQKEMLRLYKEEGFNPMGGCLPMLIPFPILLTLYFVFANAIAFRGVEFLWLPDLSQHDPLYILPIVLGISMFALQWLSTKSAGDQNPQMKIMMYTMPPFMTFIFLRFASGLNLYYATMNLASIPQQIQIMRERQRLRAAKK
jgi:YidC/Oxa1 family membrane protein insertase